MNGQKNENFNLLYGGNKTELEYQKQRYHQAMKKYYEIFGEVNEADVKLFSVPGRSEICGNHTDHNHGIVIACAVNLDIIAVVSANRSGQIRIKSEDYEMDVVEMTDTMPKKSEYFHPKALIRGILSRLNELGYETGNGFDAYTVSSIPKGMGLSSSAAFEVMVVNIFSNLYNDGKIEPVVMAQVSQFAESVYYGKPCGLMDQLACAVGGLIKIDFADSARPQIEKLNYNFTDSTSELCIVNTLGSHSDLNDDYNSIQNEMKHVAKELGHQFLSECDSGKFFDSIGTLRGRLNDRELLRAIHFFDENARVDQQVLALKTGDFETFKKIIIESGRSSFMYLQNSYSIKTPLQQGISLGLALSERLLEGYGAWRVHGGGFAGTILAFVPHDMVSKYISTLDNAFGEKACYCLSVRQYGASCIH
jgi:Galactokinase